MLKAEIIKDIKSKQLSVVICGAGVVGKVLLSLCRDEGLEVDCFCDSSLEVAQSDFCGLEVIHTPALKTKYQDAVILISVAAIKDVVDLLQEMGFTNWYAGGLLLKDLDVTQAVGEACINYPKYAIETCILCHEGFLNPQQIFVRSIDLIITERCSLKCKDCSNLMQYYERPKNCDTDMLLQSIDAFCAVIDQVLEFRVIGGETFMNKEWPVIIKRLTDEPKAKRVVLYSNGTIIPKEQYVSYLKNDKVMIVITDYGNLSRKLTELVPWLEQHRIAYHVLRIQDWLDCSAILKHHRLPAESQELFKICCAKNMATLSDGKIFRCPYSANAARLSAVPDYTHDYVDLFQEPLDAEKINETKNKVRNFLFNINYLETCDYCSGRPLSGSKVKPAVQIDKPLAYQKYE